MRVRGAWHVMLLLGLVPTAVLAQPAGPLGSEFHVNTVTAYDQNHSSAAMDGGGNFVIVWQDSRNVGQPAVSGNRARGASVDIFGQLFDSDANRIGGDFQVNLDANYNYNYYPAVARSTQTGNFVVVWQGGANGNGYAQSIHAQLFNSAGVATGSEFSVTAAGSAYRPEVSMDAAGNFVVVWQQYLGSLRGLGSYIYGRRFNSSGTALGGTFPVNNVNFDGYTPAVASNPSTGEFIVVWQDADAADGDGTGILARRYQSDGTALTMPFVVNSTTVASQRVPSVAANGAGDFLVVWNGDTPPFSQDVYAQRYASAGAALGGEFLVNTSTINYQTYPDVSAARTQNRFVVSWDSSYQNNDSRNGVYGQQFDANGGALGGELHVNTYTSASQHDSTVSMDPGGSFVVAWSSDCSYAPGGRRGRGCAVQEGQGGYSGVYAQVYRAVIDTPTPTLTPTATATPTVTATPSATATPTVTATPGVLCSRPDGCFLWELLSVQFPNPADALFEWRLTNSCPAPLARADFRFVPDVGVTAPTEGATFDSGMHTYTADVVGPPHAGVGFVPSDGNPIAGGQFDVFSFTAVRGDLTSGTVLWNSASTSDPNTATGRIDIRSDLCYALARVVEGAEACFQAQGADWDVNVSWFEADRSGTHQFNLYRRDATNGLLERINATPLEPDASGAVRFQDRCPAGSASAYRIEPLTRDGVPDGGVADVAVRACATTLGQRGGAIQIVLALVLLLGTLAVVSGRRRRGQGATR